MKENLTKLLKRSKTNLLKKFISKCKEIDPNKLYTSIDDLPVYYWNKIHETNKLKYLFKEKVDIVNNDQLSLLWANINDQYFKEFGLSK